jgi:hypothetical protein
LPIVVNKKGKAIADPARKSLKGNMCKMNPLLLQIDYCAISFMSPKSQMKMNGNFYYFIVSFNEFYYCYFILLWRYLMQSGESGRKLSELIKKAIDDCELTMAEHEEILALSSQDGVIDAQERALLAQLQELIANGTVKKVR